MPKFISTRPSTPNQDYEDQLRRKIYAAAVAKFGHYSGYPERLTEYICYGLGLPASYRTARAVTLESEASGQITEDVCQILQAVRDY